MLSMQIFEFNYFCFTTDTAPLTTIINKTNLLAQEKRLYYNLALVLLHDLLFTNHGIQASDGIYRRAVIKHEIQLRAELVRLKIRMRVKSNEELIPKDIRNSGESQSRKKK